MRFDVSSLNGASIDRPATVALAASGNLPGVGSRKTSSEGSDPLTYCGATPVLLRISDAHTERSRRSMTAK